MFEQIFKNIDDILYKDAGADSELDYIEQTSWVLFLRYLDELEREKVDKATLEGKKYKFLLDEKYRWSSWAMPKTKDGKVNYSKRLQAPDLIRFVENELFPYLANIKSTVDDVESIEYKISEIFSELKNKVKSGNNLLDIIELADGLKFGSIKNKHEMSHLYESKIKNMGNAGRNGGQYYTPRPLIRAMIKVVNPEIGERIYDPACGSAGFLCEAYNYLYKSMDKTSKNLKTLHENTLFGKEKKNLAYLIGTINMILHGIESPKLFHVNTLGENLQDIKPSDRYDVILTNPPFGGKERKEVQENFPIKTGETAFLFLQHFIKSLKPGGRAGVVIKNTFLSNSDNASIALRRELLNNCDLHTILDMPSGTFLGAGVKTVVLFFNKGDKTKNIWYYQLAPERNLGKTNPLNDEDMKEFVKLHKTKPETENSWNVKVADIQTHNYDLSVKNPNKKEEVTLRQPQAILEEMKTLDEESAEILNSILELI
ncbi:MAG: N-6 DNA methylase [Candidatus Kapabacteria bacterium]|nr:N-6 DNA methylase [Candidatus Kapabacteria bacterium]